MRTDPTDNGGLFIGRRPGTRPIKYRSLPERRDRRRQRIDKTVAAAILVLMTIIGVSFWGPIPAGCLWIGSRFNYWTDSVVVGLVVAFACMLLALFVGLIIMKQLDQAWILMRRAAGYDQRQGVIGRIFAISAGIGVVLFVTWFLLVAGPGPSIAPSN